MKRTQGEHLGGILNYFNLLTMVLGSFLYSLGLALASYLKIKMDWIGILAGVGFWLCSQLVEGVIPWATVKKQEQLQKSERKFFFTMALTAFLFTLMTFLLVIIIQLTNNIAVVLFLIIFLLLTLARSLKITQTKMVPYREILDAIILAGLLPAFSFLIVADEFHRFLALFFIPLVFIILGAMIALAFPRYASDLSQNRSSFLVKIGWQQASVLHDISLLGGLLMLGIAGLAGLPWVLLWPNALLLPVIIIEIVMLRCIMGGARKNWRLLRLNAISILFLSTYIMIFSLLIN